MNPNYRYRPTYRKEVPSKRRRKKAVDEEEIEEEDRKCEVVARVLLEGREVDTEALEKEVEEQKIKDQQEGRLRISRSRSRSRSNSKLNDAAAHGLAADAQAYFLGANGRPSSAPPQGAEASGMEGNFANHNPGQLANVHNRPKRSRTIATSGSADFVAGDYSAVVQHNGHMGAYTARPSDQRAFMGDSLPHTFPPSLRNASNLQHLFTNEPSTAASEPAQGSSIFNQYTPTSQSPFLSSYAGFKGTNADPSLLSPSFSRKFSLGRWEVPHHTSSQLYNTLPTVGEGIATQTGIPGAGMPPAALQQSAMANAAVTSATSSLGSQDQPNYSAIAQPLPEQPFDPAAVPPGYNFVPTYVYLSKEDAQNPQVSLLHSLSWPFR